MISTEQYNNQFVVFALIGSILTVFGWWFITQLKTFLKRKTKLKARDRIGRFAKRKRYQFDNRKLTQIDQDHWVLK